MLISLLVALLPIGAYLVLMHAFDAFSMVRWRTILCWLLWGAASAVLVWGIGQGLKTGGNGLLHWTPWMSPLLEETVKLLPLFVLILRRRVAFLAETMLIGQAIGGGFALFENAFYLHSLPGMGLLTVAVRGFGTTMLHMGCTATAATLILSCSMLVAQHLPRAGKMPLLLSFLLVVPSVAIHTVHNTAGLNPVLQMLSVVVLFFVIFYGLSWINERLIVRWLDATIVDDVELIAALRQGRLSETKAGQYLCSLRSRFDPYDFFDMTAYLLLYLQLTMAAKRRVMLRDAGLEAEMPLTREERMQNQAMLAELKELARRIPRLGHTLLQPLIHASDQNLHAFRQLC